MNQAAKKITARRADGSILEATVVTRGRVGRERQEVRLFEPVVGPHGDVKAAEINTTLAHAGWRFVRLVEGEIVLTQHAKKLGYMLYRDLCMYGIPSKGVDPSPVHWRIYQKLAELKSQNRVPKTKIPPEKMYHPEVVRRREQDTSGVGRISDEEMEKILAAIPEDTPEEIERARQAGLRVPEPESSESLASLLDEAEKKGKKKK